MFILSFDFGIKYIGVAIGQKITKTACPLTSIFVNNKKNKWTAVFQCIDIWSPSIIVVGYPYSDVFCNDFILTEVNKFVSDLSCKYGIQIVMVDEGLSTWEAKKKFSLAKNKKRDYFSSVNAMSASILLEQWFSDNKF